MATGVASLTYPGSGSNYINSTNIDYDNSYTLLCWQYTNDATSRGVITNGTTNSAKIQITGGSEWRTQYNGTISNASPTSTTTVTTSKWWFLAGMHEMTGKEITINVGDSDTNIVEENSSTYTGVGDTNEGDRVVRFGILGTLTTWNFDGEIGQGLVYTRALSVAEMQEIQWNPAAIPAESAWIPMWDASSPLDLSPAQTNPSIVGSLVASANGPPIFLLGGQ